ncbi:hypothetical protein [Streptomyces sp. NPDC051569]|uniref:hypothetical protein n=1 Tax=Streptomyces sp. NPDC051569 TaxID=3365661 RepID=UPI0037BCA766
MSEPRPGTDVLEQRLRAALEARSLTVHPRDLRRASPPSAGTVRRFPVRSAVLVLFGLAAALVCVLLVPAERQRVEPAGPPAPTVSPSDRPLLTPSPSESPMAAMPTPVGGAALPAVGNG